jgi:hypothetical protein
MQQHAVIYISKATTTLRPETVQQIANSSAEKNQKADVTGLLLQIGNYFVQILEGEEQTLEKLLRKIERDDRHSELRVIYQKPIRSKTFAQWNMGYFNIEEHYQANRLDVLKLRNYVDEMFATRETSKKAIVQIIRSMPALMQAWEG